MTRQGPIDDTTAPDRPPIMLSLLGSFRLSMDGVAANVKSGSKSEHLLVRLAMARRRRVRREALLQHIWPDSEQDLSGQCLNSLTYQLNRVTSDRLGGDCMIVCEDGYYRLNGHGRVGVDVDLFDTWRRTGVDLLGRDDADRGVLMVDLPQGLIPEEDPSS